MAYEQAGNPFKFLKRKKKSIKKSNLSVKDEDNSDKSSYTTSTNTPTFDYSSAGSEKSKKRGWKRRIKASF